MNINNNLEASLLKLLEECKELDSLGINFEDVIISWKKTKDLKQLLNNINAIENLYLRNEIELVVYEHITHEDVDCYF